MKIKMIKSVMGNTVRRSGSEHEVSEAEGLDLIQAGYAVRLHERETASSPQAAKRETAAKFTDKNKQNG